MMIGSQRADGTDPAASCNILGAWVEREAASALVLWSPMVPQSGQISSIFYILYLNNILKSRLKYITGKEIMRGAGFEPANPCGNRP
jgi:hypothetical protein